MKVSSFFLILTAASLLTACMSLSDPETSQIHNLGSIATIGPTENERFSQTLISRRSGLNSIKFWVSRDESQPADNGQLIIELVTGSPAAESRYRGVLSVNTFGKNSPVLIEFPPLKDSPNQLYRLILTAQDTTLQVHGRDEDSYPHGEAYSHDIVVGDLAFQTTYQYGLLSILEDTNSLFRNAWLTFAVLLITIIPGWFILTLLKLDKSFDLWEKTALASGLSLAVLPLVMLWTTQAGIPWKSAGLWLALVPGTLFVVYQSLRKNNEAPHQPFQILDGLILVTLVLVVATRLIMVRDMSAPAWVDSIHHAWIGRLISEQGMFPGTFLPYTDSNVTSYHLGFHSSLAAIKLLSGQEISTILLYYGQVLNVVSILSVYLFTNRLLNDKRAALVSALAAGLFSPMPAYFTSWGRYTHLAGLLILPAAAVFIKMVFDNKDPERKWALLALTAISSAGLFMVHYRVAGFLALLFVPILANYIFITKSPIRKKLRVSTEALIFIGILSIILTAPWFFRVVSQTILPTIAQQVIKAQFLDSFSWQLILAGLGWYPFILGCLGLALSILLLQPAGGMLLVWIGLMSILANLHAFGLPGGNLVNNTAFAITLYLPISALAGYFVSRLVQGISMITPQRLVKWVTWILVLAYCAVAVYGALNTVHILNEHTYLTRQPDLEAVAWIRQNIPPDAQILINPFLWGYGLYAGEDGGYWITALSGQPTIPPPVIQNPANWENLPAINAISQQVLGAREDPIAIHEIMVANNIQYVFLGARGGSLSQSTFSASPLFQRVYARNGVWVFKANP